MADPGQSHVPSALPPEKPKKRQNQRKAHYSHAPHNKVSFNDRPHIRQWWEFLEIPDKLIGEENYLQEQIFNMDETSLFWKQRCLKGLSSISRPSQCQVSRFVYTLYRRLGEIQGRCGRVRKSCLPSEFDPRTVQPVARSYTDRAIPAHTHTVRRWTFHDDVSVTPTALTALQYCLVRHPTETTDAVQC